ncbi:hypothetical protein [Bacillus alkalicellulosilyticus]|uniref:hypothetical protein n=1 Tax=Alkalihalobacterium alkalicellulosilyticum TaxID=1912214 RepID=UPI0009988A0B|nr:hypothetical protein [Bacillus alkalicellulosilyticus]
MKKADQLSLLFLLSLLFGVILPEIIRATANFFFVISSLLCIYFVFLYMKQGKTIKVDFFILYFVCSLYILANSLYQLLKTSVL